MNIQNIYLYILYFASFCKLVARNAFIIYNFHIIVLSQMDVTFVIYHRYYNA